MHSRHTGTAEGAPQAEGDESAEYYSQLDSQEYVETLDIHENLGGRPTLPPPIPRAREDEAALPASSRLGLIAEAKNRLRLHGTAAGVDYTPDEEFLERLHSIALDPARFKAGRMAQHHDALQLWLADHTHRPVIAEALKIVQHGAAMTLVPATAECQDHHPRAKQKKDQGWKLVMKLTGQNASEARQVLGGAEPPPCRLPNRQSVLLHRGFVRQQIDKDVRDGSLVPLDQLGFTLPEQQLYKQHTWMWATDQTSGYHNLNIVPEHWRFFGLSFEGIDYVSRAMCFGWSAAPRLFSLVGGAIQTPLRLSGSIRCTMIDDTAAAADTKEAARYQCQTDTMLYTALGITMSLHKCQLIPTQRCLFLGMLIDTAQGLCEVPEDKMQHFLHRVQACLQAGFVSRKDALSIAGMILSFKPAFNIAPHFAQGLYQLVYSAEGGADLEWTDQPHALEDLLFWQRNMRTMNGKLWHPSEPTVTVYGDASNLGTGAYFVHPHTRETVALAVGTFTEQQSQESSTLRELRCMNLAVRTVISRFLHLLGRGRLLYIGDSMPAIAIALKMGAKGNYFTETREMFSFAAAHKVELSFQWERRNTKQMEAADALSREIDHGQIFIGHNTFKFICRELRCGWPTLDAFAGPLPHEHKARAYFGKYPSQGDWSAAAKSQDRPPLAWVFPPLGMESAALHVLSEQLVSSVFVVLGNWELKQWATKLREFPVVHQWSSGYHKGLYHIGKRAPASMSNLQLRLTAFYMKY